MKLYYFKSRSKDYVIIAETLRQANRAIKNKGLTIPVKLTQEIEININGVVINYVSPLVSITPA